eukprot:13221635-Heterocapsa_arctica.AAC.1
MRRRTGTAVASMLSPAGQATPDLALAGQATQGPAPSPTAGVGATMFSTPWFTPPVIVPLITRTISLV